MGRLEITYEITGFDGILYSQQPSWENCKFSMEKENLAIFSVWEDGINNASQLEAAKNNITQRVKSFVLALEFKLGRPLEYAEKSTQTPTIITENGTLHLLSKGYAKSFLSFSVSPSNPPKDMPSLPLECERWVLTLAEAYIFGQYVEEQFKRQYLIIEELWDEFAAEFDAATKNKREELKLIRDFVSHPVCCNKKIVEFVSNKLPSSIFYDGTEARVRFLSNDTTHRNFVARYEVKSREISRSLVEKKILQYAD